MTSGSSLLVGGDDTIVALSTADGRGALALIRLTGARARDIARALGASELMPRMATRVLVHHPETHAPIDDAVMTFFAEPNSYTGEDVLEISTHGGRISPRLVVSACMAAGARMALPGEFTRRAVLNGRMDLVQAEAVADLIDARTSAMHTQALRQLDGALSRQVSAIRDALLQLEALIAYDIDFPEEDDGPIDPVRIKDATTTLLATLDRLLITGARAEVLRDGALVVIAGPPNAGKSSLFNALLGENRALVTPLPGTTRDAVEAVLDTPGVPLRLVDTAGLRTTDDLVEKLGIEVSERYLGAARVVLACGDNVADLEHSMAVVRARTSAPIISVLTKADSISSLPPEGAIAVSATERTGLVELLDAIVAAAVESTVNSDDDIADAVVVSRERQRQALAAARSEVEAFRLAWEDEHLPATIAAVHLQTATEALNEMIGSVTVDDILDRVFREFCVGK